MNISHKVTGAMDLWLQFWLGHKYTSINIHCYNHPILKP